MSSTSPIWKAGGVGSTDVAALMGCGYDGGPLRKWAEKIELREGINVKKVAEMEQGTTEWLEWRQKGIGGSEVSSVMNANPWKSASRVLKEKLGEVKGDAENENMKRGKDLEPGARQLYQQLMGYVVRPLCVIHDDHAFMRCSLDGLRDDDQLVVEIKSPREKGHRKALLMAAEADQRVQQETFKQELGYYWWQTCYQMLITGAPQCHYVSYCPGDFADHEKIAVVPLVRDEKDEEYLFQRVSDFWGYVERREPLPRKW